MSENKEKEVIHALVMTIVLVLGTVFPSMIVFGGSESFEEGDIVVLAYADSDDEVKELSEYGEIIDHYGRNVLIRTTEKGEEELKIEHDIRSLDHRNELIVKGQEFDTSEGMPEIQEDLKIDDYEPGREGIYLVDLIGPVNPEWREKIEEKGVEIINYIPNYAYEVRMTPEQSEEVEDLFFVDWVGVYQPGFKLAEDVEPGLVNVKLTDEIGSEIATQISSKVESLWVRDLSKGRSHLTAEVKTKEALVELAHMSEVYYISNHPENRLYDEVATQIIGGGAWIWDQDDDPYNPWRGRENEFEYGAHVNQLGFSGNGEIVAVADTGINPDHHDFQDRVIGGYSFGEDDEQWEDDHGHGTHVAGSIAGNTFDGTGVTVDEFDDVDELGPYYAAQGLAYDSELFSMKVFDSEGDWIGPADYFEIVEVANQNGNAYIHSNSWGSTKNLGEYLDSSEAYDKAIRDANRSSDENEPMVIVVAAGNQGSTYNTIGAPATAKNVISVGSTENFMPDFDVDNPDRISSSSSRGWTDDNRIKPDVVAPGEEVISTDHEDNEWYNRRSGTSMATPAVSGAAAVVVEWYEEEFGERPSPAMVKALLINSAYDLDDYNGNTGPIPNRDEGWGMVNLPALLDSSVEIKLQDQDSLITTGEEDEYEISYDDDGEPLKITLTWTDKEAQAGDTWTLKNDLNLEVISPNGNKYRGNAFEKGWTQPNTETMDDFDTDGDGWDDVNNVQNVYIPPEDLENGTYTVRVKGENVPADANNDGEANQDYSLIKRNSVGPEPGPLFPTHPDPTDGASGLQTEVELSVYVEHEEGDNMDVYFYDASDDTLIGDDNDVPSGERAYSTWSNLDTGTEYYWYAVADDGTQTATSDTWSFTTEVEYYTIKIDSTDGGNVVEPGEGTYEYETGTVVNLEAVADKDYNFVEWTGDVENIENKTAGDTTLTVESDYSITANFEIIEVDNVVIHPKVDQELEAGEELEFTAEAYDEHGNLITDEVTEFIWQNIHDIDSEENVAIFYEEKIGEYEVTATFDDTTSSRTTVTVNPSDVSYIEISPQEAQIIAGETQSYQATAYDKYDNEIGDVTEETTWSIEEGAGGSWDQNTGTYTSKNDGTWTVIGKYEGLEDTAILTVVVETYDLTISILGEGSTDPPEGTHTYDESEEVTIEAEADEGWLFYEWTGDVTGTDTTIDITMDEDKEITANFKEEPDPAYFKVEITGYEENVTVGETITLKFTVTNTGELEDTQEIVFSVNDDEQKSEEITLGEDERWGASFTWEADYVGEYELTLSSEDDEDTVMITVKEEEEEMPGFTTVLLILSAITSGAIYYKKEEMRPPSTK